MGGINKALRLFKKSKIEDIKSGKEKSFTDLKTFKSLFKRKFAPLYKQKVKEVNLKQFKADWEYKSGMNLDAPVGLSKEEKKGILKGQYTKRELKNLAGKISGGNEEMKKWLTGVKFNEKGEIIGGKGYRKNKRIIAGEVDEAYDKMKGGVHDKYRFKDPFDNGWTQSLSRPSLPEEVWDEKYNPTPPPIPDPKVDLITPKITPTKFDLTLPQYQIEKSTGEQLIPGTPGHWLNWFKIQRKIPNNIGNTIVYPPTGKEYIIELGGDTVPGTPGEVISTQDYSITKDGQPMDMSGLSEYERKSIYRDVKREYLKTADTTDQAKMYFEEFGYDKGWDEFLEYKKNN